MGTTPPTPAETVRGPAELAALLNRATVRLSEDVAELSLTRDLLRLKYRPGRKRLVVTRAQWGLLRNFQGGRTVPSVLCEAIAEQRSPPLREFYDLVVRATEAGVLQAEGLPVPAAEAPAGWPLRIPGAAVRWTTLAVMVGACAALVLFPARLPVQPAWLVLGWLAVCLAASLGAALAAAVTRAAGGEVYRPRLEWKTPFPRFRVDTDDAAMGGRNAEIDVALARLLPGFLFAGLAAWRLPDLAVPLIVGLLAQLSPLWRTPMLDLMEALWRDPRQETNFGLTMAQSRLWALLGQARRQMADGRFLLACALGTVAWLVIVFLAGCVLWQANVVELLERFQASGGWQATGLVGAGMLGLLIAGAAGTAAWIGVCHVRAWWQEWAERRMRPQTALISPEKIAEWLGRTVLFRELGPDDLKALAAAVVPEQHKRGAFVVKEGEAGDRLYVVVSGRLEVRRDYAPGRSEPVAHMEEGDIFGEIALLQGGVRTRSIRSLGTSVLLALGKADFERLVLSRLTRQTVEDAVQKVGFLHHIELARNWTPAALAAFAQKAKISEYREGAVLVQEGQVNPWFYLVHRGEFAVEQRGKEIRRLKMGDSFGELSLIGDGSATASVIVRSKAASCLLISGADFLKFITGDFAMGLEWERIGARRTGRPVLAPPRRQR